MNKKCTKCKTEKTLSEFYKDASTKDGLRSECKTCTNVRIKTRQERNARTAEETLRRVELGIERTFTLEEVRELLGLDEDEE